MHDRIASITFNLYQRKVFGQDNRVSKFVAWFFLYTLCTIRQSIYIYKWSKIIFEDYCIDFLIKSTHLHNPVNYSSWDNSQHGLDHLFTRLIKYRKLVLYSCSIVHVIVLEIKKGYPCHIVGAARAKVLPQTPRQCSTFLPFVSIAANGHCRTFHSSLAGLKLPIRLDSLFNPSTPGKCRTDRLILQQHCICSLDSIQVMKKLQTRFFTNFETPRRENLTFTSKLAGMSVSALLAGHLRGYRI